MTKDMKNLIAQKVVSLLIIVALIVFLPYLDYDVTPHVVMMPLCLYLLFTRKALVEFFEN